MEYITSIIVSFIGLVSAVWSPAITALIQRDKELRLKKLEIYQQAKLNAYLNFSNCFSQIYHLTVLDGETPFRELVTASNTVLIYCNKQTGEKLIRLLQMIYSMPFKDHESNEQFKSLFFDVMASLNAEINAEKG